MTATVNTLSVDVSTRSACELVGLSRAGKYRAAKPADIVAGPALQRRAHNALTRVERDQIIDVLTSMEFVDKAPIQVYYVLLERGQYLASPRTMYRVLADADLLLERRAQATHPARAVPHLHATGPCQVASWDITALRGPGRGVYFYGFMMVDIFSRLMPAARSFPGPREEYVEEFIEACIAGFDGVIPETIHSDNGSAMIAGSVADLYERLAITRSLSRPRVSNDNPYSEAPFKTTKYCPAYPGSFDSIVESQEFLDDLRYFYNNHHYHSGLKFYTPTSVHNGTWPHIQAKRQHTLDAAYAQNPHRFTRPPHAPAPPAEAWINRPQSTITTTDPQEALTQKS